MRNDFCCFQLRTRAALPMRRKFRRARKLSRTLADSAISACGTSTKPLTAGRKSTSLNKVNAFRLWFDALTTPTVQSVKFARPITTKWMKWMKYRNARHHGPPQARQRGQAVERSQNRRLHSHQRSDCGPFQKLWSRSHFSLLVPTPCAGAGIGELNASFWSAQVVIETLADLGAQVRWSACNIYSTQVNEWKMLLLIRSGKFRWTDFAGSCGWSSGLHASYRWFSFVFPAQNEVAAALAEAGKFSSASFFPHSACGLVGIVLLIV